MAGLESIALAVAHLEQESRAKENGCEEFSGSWGWLTNIEPTIPPRQPITARRVSSDSCFSEEYEPTQTTSMQETMDAVAADIDMMDAVPPTLESLFEAEKSKPNIPTPDTTEDISNINDNDVLCGRGGETNHWSK